MAHNVSKLEIAPQSVLLVRRQVEPSALASVLAAAFPRLIVHARHLGAYISGRPFVRYLECWPGLTTIEAGIPIAETVAGSGDILSDRLPGGLVATTMHHGVRYSIEKAYAAVRLWIAEQGLEIRGGPWESWLTDPSGCPDPAAWKTAIYWPVDRLQPGIEKSL